MPDRPIGDGKVTALLLLKQAYDDAAETKRSVNQFAVTSDSLLEAGANESDLRWLLAQRLAEQFLEISRDSEAERTFRAVKSLRLAPNACFILTYAGKVFIERRRLDREPPTGAKETSSRVARASETARSAARRIAWDGRRHELLVEGKVAKRFLHPAPTQWSALDLFEGDGWKGPIEIFPSGSATRDAAQRLRELVKELNHGLDQSLIKFRRDVSGPLLITFDLNRDEKP
jgi:hypothetical protein